MSQARDLHKWCPELTERLKQAHNFIADRFATAEERQRHMDAIMEAVSALSTSSAISASEHKSDCAVHNEPAYPAGPCDCKLEIDPATGLPPSVLAFEDLIQQPPQYEDMHRVREYRHSIYPHWAKVIADFRTLIAERSAHLPEATATLPPMNADLLNILGRMCFQCGPIADLMRANGYAIPQHAEEEQAWVIYWSLGLYLEHGALWGELSDAQVKQWVKDAIQRSKDAKDASLNMNRREGSDK